MIHALVLGPLLLGLTVTAMHAYPAVFEWKTHAHALASQTVCVALPPRRGHQDRFTRCPFEVLGAKPGNGPAGWHGHFF